MAGDCGYFFNSIVSWSMGSTRRGVGAQYRQSHNARCSQNRELGHQLATLWTLWARYKDVVHLVTAAALIRKEARKRCKRSCDWPPGLLGLDETQILPFQIAWLMPDLVLAVAWSSNDMASALSTGARSKHRTADSLNAPSACRPSSPGRSWGPSGHDPPEKNATSVENDP